MNFWGNDMFTKMALLTLLITTNLFACTTMRSRGLSSLKELTGGRVGLHGMVIFGKGSYFIEHIPMLHPPHDFQIVASILIKNKIGEVLKPDLSQSGFTLQPNVNFSLNDFINGGLKKFEAQLFIGSFEQDGKVVAGFEDITIEIQEILLARKLPQTTVEKFFEVKDISQNVFRSSIITPQNNNQIIKNMGSQKTLWCVLGPDFFEPCP